MKISYDWLKQYISVPWGPQELADKLTMAGLEVEGISSLAPKISGVYVGQIMEVEPHPQAELVVCQISIGERQLQIVCGAPNAKVNLKVPVAIPGAVLADGTKIATTNLRGVMSYGMACSEAELGLSEDNSGLMELPNETQVGQDLVEALGLDDQILDVSIYANRPDCMSLIGIAREVAVLANTSVKHPKIDFIELETKIEDLTSVQVDDEEKCPRYCGRVLLDVKVGPSPLWLQQRLRASGMRPINNIVDITNFVMLEMGQPLHAFDYDKLAGNRIVVRTPKAEEEKFITLDGVERDLTLDMLLICDADVPVCIGGVMGGLNSEVTSETRNIFLEAANFAPVSIRRTGHKLGISSEALIRFEKGIHPELTLVALDRAAQLMQEYAGAQVVNGIIDVNNARTHQPVIDFSPEAANLLLGTNIPSSTMVDIFTSLELTVDKSTHPWRVTIPSFRRDLELECDLIEEVARFWGFHRIPVTLPKGGQRGGQNKALEAVDALKSTLVGVGLNEIITYSFVNPSGMQKSRLNDSSGFQMIKLMNPLTEDYQAMRTRLIPSLLECAVYNVNRQQERLSLFEFGSIYLAEELPLKERPLEKRKLGLLLYGQRSRIHWAAKPEYFDFYDLKGLVELVCEKFSGEFNFIKGDLAIFHPGRQGRIEFAGQIIGEFGELHPAVQKDYGIPNRIYLAEIELDNLLEYTKLEPKFKSLPRFPAVLRDMALIVPQDMEVESITNVLEQAGGDLLTQINVFDVYQGGQVETGHKSVAFSFIFSANRTLTDEEVNNTLDLMYREVSEKCGAVIR